MNLEYIFGALALAGFVYFLYHKVKNRDKKPGGRTDYGDPKPPQQER